MNNEKQRIAIAEACGNKPHTPGALGVLRWISAEYETGDLGNGVVYLDELPDYLNDLNAMHEAEKVLHGQLNLWWNYMDALENSSVEFNPLGRGSHIHATAEQRAEAFLRTIGKWAID